MCDCSRWTYLSVSYIYMRVCLFQCMLVGVCGHPQACISLKILAYTSGIQMQIPKIISNKDEHPQVSISKYFTVHQVAPYTWHSAVVVDIWRIHFWHRSYFERTKSHAHLPKCELRFGWGIYIRAMRENETMGIDGRVFSCLYRHYFMCICVLVLLLYCYSSRAFMNVLW